MQGRLAEARRLFERLLGAANDLGLFSEEIRPRDGSAWDNFPQALSHVAMINSALTLSAEGAPPRLD
jgi:GH15 family glucan-1,4-alpha-glucosidase